MYLKKKKKKKRNINMIKLSLNICGHLCGRPMCQKNMKILKVLIQRYKYDK